jgi:hypothetical protein
MVCYGNVCALLGKHESGQVDDMKSPFGHCNKSTGDDLRVYSNCLLSLMMRSDSLGRSKPGKPKEACPGAERFQSH